MSTSQLTRQGVVSPVRVDPDGLRGPTKAQARGPEWRRTSRGLYVPAYVDPDPPWQRIAEAAAGIPASAAVTGWAGLSWIGSRWFGGLDSDGATPIPIPIALGDDRTMRPRSGVSLSEEWLAPHDVVSIDGLRITIPVRSTCFAMRHAPSRTAAVVAASMAAFSDHASLEEISDYALQQLVARPGTARIHAALALADENCWSPREAMMLVTWTAAGGFPRPLCNAPIFDDRGKHLFTPDLFDPEHGVVGEYDSLIHLEDGRRGRDVNREEIIKELGLELVTMVTADNADHRTFLHRLAAAYRRASKRNRSDGWTIDHPAWWQDTSTVEKRRALSDADRARLLTRQVA